MKISKREQAAIVRVWIELEKELKVEMDSYTLKIFEALVIHIVTQKTPDDDI